MTTAMSTEIKAILNFNLSWSNYCYGITTNKILIKGEGNTEVEVLLC